MFPLCSPRRLLLPLVPMAFLLLIESATDVLSSANCFFLSSQRALSNAIPSREFYNVSPEDCRRFCVREKACHTVVYHRHFSTCQLYAGANEGGRAQEVTAKGHDLYVRKNAEECEEEGEKERKDDPRKEAEEKRNKTETNTQG